MHEFSLAINIVEIAEENARNAKAEKITSIAIEVGEMSGVIYEALETAMESAIKNTILDGAKVNIIKIPAKARCLQCKKEFEIHDHFESCPDCESMMHEIFQGKELKVKSLEAS